MIRTTVAAVSVERITPTYVRVELGSPDLADFGVDGPLYDQRIKLIFPPDQMRTYTVREVRGSGAETRLVVDFVLHLEEGLTGPGSSWAASAQAGDRLVVVAPRRGQAFGGIEFAPDSADNLLVVADETAVPAVASILADLDDTARGVAFLEVPCSDDVMPLRAPAGVEVVWLPRDGAPHGVRQVAAVREHLGLTPTAELVDVGAVAPDLWETPTYSSSGEEIAATAPVAADLAGLYAWIAGESRVVTTLRRCLVKELAVDRRQVAFMGYWRRGVAMRS